MPETSECVFEHNGYEECINVRKTTKACKIRLRSVKFRHSLFRLASPSERLWMSYHRGHSMAIIVTCDFDR